MKSGRHQFYSDQFPGAFNFIYIQFPHSFLQFLIGWFSEATTISSETEDVSSAHGGDNLQQLIIFTEMWLWDLAEYEGLCQPGSAGPHRGRISWWFHNAEFLAQVHRAALWNTFHLSHEPNVLVWDLSCSTGLFEVGSQLPKDSPGVSAKTASSRVPWLEWQAKSSQDACKGETNLIHSIAVQLSQKRVASVLVLSPNKPKSLPIGLSHGVKNIPGKSSKKMP